MTFLLRGPQNAAVFLLAIATFGVAAPPTDEPAKEGFVASDVMIPMRDGVRLHARIFRPKDQREDLPFIFNRTPYGVGNSARHFGSYMKSLVEEGYLFIFEDIRGKFGSEGEFVMQRPPRTEGDEKALDEGTDTYDTIEWLIKNVPRNNGRVGMLGISYDGWTTINGALEPHPALKAISPQASPADMWLGDDFHHNGAFRLSYGFEYAALMEAGKETAPFVFDRYDTFDWYLDLGPLANVNARHLRGKIPTWNDFAAHPDYDAFWRRQTLIPHIRAVKIPTLNVAGWWDQEDFYGPMRIYEALERHDTANRNYLVVGPWNHGGWARGAGDRLGPIGFDSATAKYFREEIQAPFFAHFLKDKGNPELPQALTFEPGSNRWRRGDSWPPRRETEARSLYFGPGRRLSFDRPVEADGAVDTFVSDPAHPVPYRRRPIQPTYAEGGSRWPTWLVEDQRFVDRRADVLSWETAPLESDLTIAGEVKANLFASTTESDADWIVKLIDVYPERNPEDWDLAGYQLMVSNEVFRGRYRKGFERPEPIPSGKTQAYTFSLHTQNYTFRKGHRVMVQVQSTWFPLIDRNPQKFVPNIFEAKESDFRIAEHRIHRSKDQPSRVVIPVVVRPSS